ncbi:MAG: class I SAM-dependent methyltransferase [Gammaproteobacteria bacterium]|jgi:ubiquinone/menaquinone biosynthesis C-methylase UbiE
MKSLPKNPSLEFLKKEAKALRAHHKRGDHTCCDRIRLQDISFQNKTDAEILATGFSINDAQRVVAREYGYTSWVTLKRYIESINLPLYHNVSDRQGYHCTITDSYDKRSKNYDNSEWHRGIAIKAVDYCPPGSGDRVLDVATGTGTIAFYAARLVGPTGHVVGIDISRGMLSKCNEKLAASGLNNLEFMYADGENLDFTANSFDRIYCTSAIFWMSNLQATLRHWFDLLKPGGHVGFNATPSNSFFWGDGARMALAKHGIEYTCNVPAGSYENAREMLELAGYDNFRFYEEKDGWYLKFDDDIGPFLTLESYAPAQYPHPLQGLSDETITRVQQDYEEEVRKRITEKGAWHDTTQYYIYGQKP